MDDVLQLITRFRGIVEDKFREVDGRDRKSGEDLTRLAGELKAIRSDLDLFARQFPTRFAPPPIDPSYRGSWSCEERAKQFGEFVLAGHHPRPEVRRACAEAVCKAGLRIRTQNGQFVAADDYVKAMGESTDAAGGYMVPDELGRELLRNVEKYGVARRFLRIVPMSAEAQAWPKRTGGPTVYYPDEGSAPTASDISLGSVRLLAKKWAILTLTSRELEEDAVISLGELLALEFALAIAHAEDLNAFRGDGTSAYAGITGVFNSPNVAVVTMDGTHTAFNDVTYTELNNVVASVPGWVLEAQDTGWFMSTSIEHVLTGVSDTMGRPVLVDPRDGNLRRLLGYPVNRAQVLPTLTDDGISTKFLAFGSLRAWGLLGQRRTLRIERSSDIKFAEDQLAYKAIVRQDIGESDGTAMAVLRTAAA